MNMHELIERNAILNGDLARIKAENAELVRALRALIARASLLDQSATYDGLLNWQALAQARAALAKATNTYPLPAIAKAK